MISQDYTVQFCFGKNFYHCIIKAELLFQRNQAFLINKSPVVNAEKAKDKVLIISTIC